MISEVGSKDADKIIPPYMWIDLMQKELDAGAWKVIGEAREAGNVGLFIANDLRAAGHDVQLIEQEPSVAERAKAEPGIEWHVADAFELIVNRRAS